MLIAPLPKQVIALKRSASTDHFAYFMDQGTGKTYVCLADAERLCIEQRISLLVVVAPNGVHRNWIERESPKLLSHPYTTLLWSNKQTKKYQAEVTKFINDPGTHLRIFAVNVEAFQRNKSRAEILVINMLKRHKALMAVDESSTIKTPSAQRTKNIIKIGRHAAIRRVLTGTPVTTGPLNFYAQANFLGKGLLGFTDFASYKGYYAEWRERTILDKSPTAKPGDTRTFKELVRYKNMDELKRRVDSFSYTVTKEECPELGLLPKKFTERAVVLGDTQRDYYDECKRQLIMEIAEDSKMTMAHAFTKIIRLRQILGGFVKGDTDDEATPIPGPNAKIEAMLTYLEDMNPDYKVIVWAAFVPELRLIADTLGRENCACYWGEVSSNDRNTNIDRFMNDPSCRYFIGNPKVGKYGFTLTIAHEVLYYSNDYSAEARWQSEDRTHRIGQKMEVNYTDLIVLDSIDTKMASVLKDRKSMADVFKGDKSALVRWLSEN